MPEPYQELNQSDYLTDYEQFEIKPPSKYAFDHLPFSDLPPRKFEQLCLKYCYKTYGMDKCILYGIPGQKQYGLDILVKGEDEKYILYQCKRVENFTGGDLVKAIDIFRNEEHQHKWYAKTSEFVLFSSNELIDTSFIDALGEQQKLLAIDGIKLTTLGSIEISEEIKNDVEIVYEFFGEAWVKSFIKKEVYEPYLSGLIKLPEKKVYDEVQDYIPRNLTNPEKVKEKYGYTYYDSQPLTDYVSECHSENKPVRVVIHSDAGLGKSKELDYLAYHYSKAGRIFPIIIRLKLYQGNLERMISAFYGPWQQVPKARLLLLFDGLDEIPNDLLDSFLKQFNFLSQDYAAANIVATARSSFSLRSVGDGIDESSVLKPQYLKPLEPHEIEKYYTDRGLNQAQSKKFDRLCNDTRLTDLLNNPFYLKNLIDLFQHPSLIFPKDRAEAIGRIIELKLEQDSNKYSFMPPAEDYLLFAKKLAIYLTLTGRNSIPEGRLSELTSLDPTNLRYCSLFTLEETDKRLSIYFVHNNFQEYLTANYLNSLDWRRLQHLLFHEPAFLILKPRLVNTANYLFTLMDKTSDSYRMFFQTLKDHNQELLLRFEKDKIHLSTRLEIFKHLIFAGKNEGLYYLRGKYDIDDLLGFIEHSPGVLGFLLAELTDPDSAQVHKKCLLELLLNFRKEHIAGSDRQSLRRKLREIIQSGETPAVHDMAIDVMTAHLFIDNNDIHICVNKCPNNHVKMVREAILKMLRSARAAKYFNYILESAPFLFPQESNSSSQLGNEYLETVLTFLNPKTAIAWLRFAESNINLLGRIIDNMYDPAERLTIQKINLTLADFYLETNDEAILKGYTAFVASIHANLSESKWGNLALFFINTNTKEEAFFSLLEKEDTVLFRSPIGADLVDDQIIDTLLQRVKAGLIKRDSLRSTRNFLHYFDRNDQFNYLNEKVLAAFPDFFRSAAESDLNWNELNRKRTERDFELFKNKESFKAEAKNIYEAAASLKDFNGDWFMLAYSEKAEIKKLVTNNIIFRMIEMHKLNKFEEFVIWIDAWKWDYYVFTQLTIYLIDQKKVLPQYWEDWLQHYVTDVLLKEIDFKKSLKKVNGRYVPINGARLIRALFMQDMVQLPQPVLFDMLSFDTSGFVQANPSPINKEHLFKKILDHIDDDELFRKRILLNLADRFPDSRVLETHCSICLSLQITEAIPLLIDHLQKRSTPSDIRESLVITIIKLGARPEILESELKHLKFVTQDWHWELFKSVYSAILNGNTLLDKQFCLAMAERSIGKHKDKSRLKWYLIKASLKLRSVKAAKNVLKYLSAKKSWSDYADIDAGDFEFISAFDPKKMIADCIKILGPALLNNTNERHNSIERFLTQLVRQLAVKRYELMTYALLCYEKMIAELIVTRPELVYLRWYEKDLVTDYYIQATTFETEHEVLNMIKSLN